MRDGWPLVAGLAAAQLVSWGSIYYGFSLFVVPMEAELGWSRTEINGALSLGLLVSGFCAYPVGAWIDRHGGRSIMALGSAVGAALLAVWSRTATLGGFYVIWVAFGFVLAATLYEPVFAVVTRRFPESYRTRITALTLIGGLASTVFIPLTQQLIAGFGWRDALVALALCNLLIGVPVHGLLLRDGKPREKAPGALTSEETRRLDDAALRRALRHRAFWALAICFTAYYATQSAVVFHIIPLLTERAVPPLTIVAAIALIGPAQVAGRIALLALGRSFSPATAGRFCVLAFPGSVALLIAFPEFIAALYFFAALFGGANGIMTIVKGTIVPDLLGREGYGAINGALTFPANVARAAAPFGAALIWSLSGGYGAVLWSILGGAGIAAVGFWYAAARA